MLPLTLLESTSLPSMYLQYTLTLYHDVIRSDTSLLDKMLPKTKGERIIKNFRLCFTRNDLESFCLDKAAFLLTSLIARANADYFSSTLVTDIIMNILNGTWKLTSYGQLDSLKNLMKTNRFRACIWEDAKAQELILTHLDASKNIVYPAVFCAWVASFDPKLLKVFMQLGGLLKLCTLLRNSKIEKVIRISLRLLTNCLLNDEALEALIDENVVQTLTRLEYEKWRDEELYTDISNLLVAFQQKTKLLNNYERYCRELETQKLHWSFLHSEKFWRENVVFFEENEFSTIKKLVLLLRSNDPITAAVACFDIGEFARLHPMGKSVIQKARAKELVIYLMSHKNRDVSREALLCVQKIMLNHWRAAVAAT
ncbi:V-type proton ATPase subunit H-like isoform X2 [Hylaeus volcanicus]|nr:V-type proton ATPase subunit H-like isoform X2 [Hylaeus volcanicus]XP_053991282.1 V-type proton ATPase subunit H-like isoform X2 [Hylaeus volcanicus]